VRLALQQTQSTSQLNKLNQPIPMKDIRIAAVIFNSPVGQVQQNLDRMIPWVKEAKKEGADLICFPELNVTGYSTDPAIKDFAESIPGPISRQLEQTARDTEIVILAGMAEKDETGRIFAGQLVTGPRGIAGVYRKLHIAPPEQAVFSHGIQVPLINILGVNLGIQLCYDAHFPELATRMAVDGADIIFMPHASPRGTPQEKLNSWLRHMTARAFDNGVFIVACNQVGENQKGLEFPGLAVVIGPSGNILQEVTTDREGMLVTDLKAEDLSAVRNHKMRYFLPNRRPELYE
jgi:N-carbamoylputrescine amidase